MRLLARLLQGSAMRVNVVVLLGLLGYLASLSFPSSEAVRLRNALLVDAAPASAFEWTPDSMPPDFKTDRGAAGALFARIAQEQGFAGEQSEFLRALKIARHVREPMTKFGPIFGDLEVTYRQIQNGDGYCADATDVFLALSRAAGLHARQWGFSIDQFGGKGHAINEVYDRQLRQWIYLDVFFNYYLVDAQTERPLSALQVRAALQGKEFNAKIVPIVASRPVDFNYDRRLRWFRSGAEHWFLWWGNNVESLDQKSSIGRLSNAMPAVLARAIEQFRGVALGVYPHMRVVETPLNEDDLSAMLALKKKLLFAAGTVSVLAVLLLAQAAAAWRRHRAARRAARRLEDGAAAHELR